MNNIIFLNLFLIFGLVACSDKEHKSDLASQDIKAEYKKNMQDKADTAKTEFSIPQNIGTPEVALCTAASMKMGKGIGIYNVWIDELNSRYHKMYSDKSDADIESYTSERVTDKLNYLKNQGYSTQDAFLKFYELNCQN